MAEDTPASTTATTAEAALATPSWVRLDRYQQVGYSAGRPRWVILLWWLVQAVAFPLTLHASHGPRCWLLRRFGATVGAGVVIRPTARFTYPWKVTLGNHCWIGDDVVFYSLDAITLGDHSVVSQNSYLCTGSHNVADAAFGLETAPIVIGNGAWVASDCFVAPGVVVGANTVVGARSTVLKSLPPGYLCWGSPCQPRQPRPQPAGPLPQHEVSAETN